MRLKHGLKYGDDIKKLKYLRLKDKADYLSFMKAMENKYNISNKTIYRDMKKRNPGLRRIRSDAGKIKVRMSPKAKKIISEVVASGGTKKSAKIIAEKITGKKITTGLLTRTKPIGIRNSSFGGDIKAFLEKICGFNMIAPGLGIKLKSGKFSFTVNKDDLSDIILILTNSYNREFDDKLPLDKNELFRKKIFQLLEYNIKLAEDSADLKSLESITRMYNSIQEDHDLGADFEILYKVCSSLKPGISRQEIISLIKQFAKQ